MGRRHRHHARLGTGAVWILLLLLCTTGTAPGQDEEILSAVPSRYRADVERALLAANDEALRASFARLSEGLEREAWAFLIASLPRAAVDGIEEAVLTEHVRHACLAHRELPWAEGVPKEVFLHWVLPPDPGTGKIRAWRKRLYDEMIPLLVRKKVRTPGQAALEVNRILERRIVDEETFGDPAGPLEILARGHGRPEERAIFFVAAARAAGVPARTVRTPWWTFRTGGGTWCEAWTGEGKPGWRPLVPGRPEARPGRWPLAADAKRAAVVLSETIGRPETADLVSWDRDGGAVVNSVGVYLTPCRLRLEVRGPDGVPAAEARVGLYVFNDEGNNAWMRPALAGRCDAEGRYELDLGPGDYLFHARDADRVGWAVARSEPGRPVRCPIVVTKPATDARTTYEKSAAAGLRLHLGAGGGGDMTASLSPLGDLPWNPFGFVGAGGQVVAIDPGFYAVVTSWRRSETTVLVSVQSVLVREGETATLRTPDFPKSSRTPSVGPGAWVLTYPRK